MAEVLAWVTENRLHPRPQYHRHLMKSKSGCIHYRAVQILRNPCHPPGRFNRRVESLCPGYARLFYLLSHHGRPDTEGDLLGRNGIHRSGLLSPIYCSALEFSVSSSTSHFSPLLPNRLFNHFCVFHAPRDLQPLRLCPTQERPALQDDTSSAGFFKEEDSPNHTGKRRRVGGEQRRQVHSLFVCSNGDWFHRYPAAIHLHQPGLSSNDPICYEYSIPSRQCYFLPYFIQYGLYPALGGYFRYRLLGNNLGTIGPLSPEEDFDYQTVYRLVFLCVGGYIDHHSLVRRPYYFV